MVFVFDVTETGGAKSSLPHQLAVYDHLRSRFPQRPWINVITKADLPQHRENDAIVGRLPEDCLRVSVKDPASLLGLQDRIVENLVALEKEREGVVE